MKTVFYIYVAVTFVIAFWWIPMYHFTKSEETREGLYEIRWIIFLWPLMIITWPLFVRSTRKK